MIQHNISLRNSNTFGIDVLAKYYCEVHSTEELVQVLGDTKVKNTPKIILGGGSNVLFTGDIDGLVIKMMVKGKKVLREDNDHVLVKVGAGENWHDFVMYCIDQGWGGVENLSLIPGTVGAAPMQNIGAYGVELQSVFESLEAIHTGTGRKEAFDNKDCKFGYRESIFKNTHRDQYVICHVTFRLPKSSRPNTSYGTLQKTLQQMGTVDPDIRAVSNAIIHIRQSKLPDPAVIGNAGSFFKNPSIPKENYDRLKEDFQDIPGYPLSDHLVKVPAGWLIEQCGWKGKKIGAIGVHEHQALVLVNHGGATGGDILRLSEAIQTSVSEKFGIDIHPEVNILP